MVLFCSSPINPQKVGSKETAEKNPLETTKPLEKSRGFDVVGVLLPQHGASNRTRTCDTIGQKHSRTASLGALALLLVSSCSRTACICHRQRRHASQLTARAGAARRTWLNAVSQVRGLCEGAKKEKRSPNGDLFSLAPQTGLEPVTPRLTAACSTD